MRGHRRQASWRRADHHHGAPCRPYRLARSFGATDVIPERGEAAAEKVRALTGGYGAHSVLECVGSDGSIETALACVRAGRAIGRVGVPHYGPVAIGGQPFFDNVTVSGGLAPVRAYMQELLPDIMEGRIEPGRVFDRTSGLADVPDGHHAMSARETLKVMVKP